MKKIAIIGASYLQLPLVRKAKEMGLEVHCFAWEKGAVCKDIADYFYPISILEKEEILQICKSLSINGITSIASDVAVPTISYVAEKLELISNSYENSITATNKFKMRKNFIENNVSSARFVVVSKDYSIEGFKFPLIVKPTDRSGSLGVMKANSISDLKDAIGRAKLESFSNEVIIEEYISGSEVSVEAISWQGKHYILAITDKVTSGEPYFVELEHHQPSFLNDEIINSIKIETIKALDSLNIKYGASHSEFKITNSEQVKVIEVGARMGGDFIGSDLVKLSTGYDFLEGVINIALGIFKEPVILYKKSSGVYFLSRETDRLLPIIENYIKFPEIIEAKITDTELRSIQSSGARSGYLIYQSGKRLEL